MTAPPHPRFTCHPTHDVASTVVAVGGDLDLFSVRLLRRLVDDAIRSPTTAVVIDLSDITFGDLTALSYLLELRQRAGSGEFSLELLPAPPTVMRLFDLTATRELLDFSVAS